MKLGSRERKYTNTAEDPELVMYVNAEDTQQAAAKTLTEKDFSRAFEEMDKEQNEENEKMLPVVEEIQPYEEKRVKLKDTSQDSTSKTSSQDKYKYDKVSKASTSNTKDDSSLQTRASAKDVKLQERKKKKKKLVHGDLLSDPGFQVIMFVTLGAINAFGVNVNFLPAMANEKGIPVFESTLLLSMIGISDCVCRVPWGLLFDVPFIKRYRLLIYNTAMLLAGTTIALFPITTSYTYLVIIALLRGSCSGLFLSQRATVLGDLIGLDRVPQAFGLQLLVTGIGTMTGRILGGLCRDYLGSYDYAFYGSGGLVALSCLSFYTFLFANWGDLQKRHKVTTTPSDSSAVSGSTKSVKSGKSG